MLKNYPLKSFFLFFENSCHFRVTIDRPFLLTDVKILKTLKK